MEKLLRIVGLLPRDPNTSLLTPTPKRQVEGPPRPRRADLSHLPQNVELLYSLDFTMLTLAT